MSRPANSATQRSYGNELAHARELIAKSRTFKELQKMLNDLGYGLDAIEDIISFAKYAWWEGNKSGSDQKPAYPPSFPWLPGTEVLIDDTHYYIHGLVHETATSGVTISSSVKNYVSSAASMFHRKENASDYVYESGLDSSFSLHPSNSMDDFTGFFSIFLQVEDNPPNDLSKDMQRYCVNLERVKGIFYYEPAETQLRTALQLGVRQLEDLISIREICENYFLPPPLAIEEKIYRVRLLAQANYPDTNYERSRLIRTLGRTKYMARYMRTYAKQNVLESLHAFVGLAHESEIAFFLTEPDYVI